MRLLMVRTPHVVVVVASGAAGFDARDRTGKAARIFCSGAIVLRGVSTGAGGVRFLGGGLINGRHVWSVKRK